MPGQYAQPKYPSMERQDLTQGQLGSFKFTPIDVPTSSTLGNTPFLLAAQAKLRERMRNRAFTADSQIDFSSLAGQKWLDEQQIKPQPSPSTAFKSNPTLSFVPSRPDPAFFNTHIKPDLEDSRLKFGTAAIRAAIDGTSPVKPFSPSRARTESNGTTTFITSPIPGRPTFAMNPKAVSFDPVASPSSEAESTIMPSYKSLVRCLEGEQERHLETKAKLAAVLSRVKELEAEVVDLYAEKQALSGSVEFMSNIIQQNMNHITKDNATNFANPSDEAGDSSKTPGPTGLTVNGNNSNNGDKILDGEAYKNVVNGHTEETGKTQPQLQTPVKLRFGEDPFITNGHALSEELKTPVKGSAISDTDEAPKFNLDLLKTGQTPGTPASARSIVLRKHFNAEDGPNNSPTDTIYGVNGSDETDDNANVAELTPTKGKSQDKNQGSSDIVQAASVAGESAATTKSQVVKLQTADDPILELPASFLAKYQKTVKKGSSDHFIHVEPESGEVSSEVANNGEPSLLITTSLRSLNDSPVLVDPAAPYELSVKWKINKENPIFDDEYDLSASLLAQPRNERNGVFWEHPVRYLEHDSKNLFRTVMIDYIPENATYLDVVSEICAGSLEKIELVPSIGEVTNYQTARVVFNFELGASTTVNYARDRGLKIKGQPVRVWQVLTQTYPKNKELEEFVFEDGFTRMLIINNATEDALISLPGKLECFKSSIIEYGRTFDGYPVVEFTSVAAAVAAMKLLMADLNFQGAEFDFDEDPCGQEGQDSAAMNGW